MVMQRNNFNMSRENIFKIINNLVSVTVTLHLLFYVSQTSQLLSQHYHQTLK